MFQLSRERHSLIKNPRILFLVPESYAALKQKGVSDMILDRDENGFFEKVFTIHPLSYKNQQWQMNERHVIQEFDLRNCFYPNKKGFLLFLFPIKFILMIIQLVKLIKTEKIDLIRATDPYLMGFIAWLLAVLTSIPFCVSIHADHQKLFALNPQKGFKNFLRIISKWMPRFVLPKAHLVMPISYHLKEAINKFVTEKKIRVILHGIDFNFTPDLLVKEKFDIPHEKKMICIVGRLSKENYIEDILQVMEKLLLMRDDCVLVMVGGGEMSALVHDWRNRIPQAKTAVYLLGFQSNEITRSLTSASDVCLPLNGGFTLIEAAAAAVPVIAYDVEWQRELVKNTQTGFLLQEHDIDGILNAICYLLDNPVEAKIMGKNAKQLAFDRHDKVYTSQLKQAYYLELIK